MEPDHGWSHRDGRRVGGNETDEGARIPMLLVRAKETLPTKLSLVVEFRQLSSGCLS